MNRRRNGEPGKSRYERRRAARRVLRSLRSLRAVIETEGKGGRDLGTGRISMLLPDILSVLTTVRDVLLGGGRAGVASVSVPPLSVASSNSSDSDSLLSGVASLLDDADSVACRLALDIIEDQERNGGGDHRHFPLCDWHCLAGLIRRAVVAAAGGSKPYEKSAAAVLAVLNALIGHLRPRRQPWTGAEASGSSNRCGGKDEEGDVVMDISYDDAFQLSALFARRAIVDITDPTITPNCDDDGCGHADRDGTVFANPDGPGDAAFELRKLVGLLLGRLKADHGHYPAITEDDAEDFADLMSEYSTEIAEHAIDKIEAVTAPSAIGNSAKDRLSSAVCHATVAVSTVSALCPLGISPCAVTSRALIAAVASLASSAFNQTYRPVKDCWGGRDIPTNLEKTLKVADSLILELFHSLGYERRRQLRGAHSFATFVALNTSQLGGGMDDLEALLDSLRKDGPFASTQKVLAKATYRSVSLCGHQEGGVTTKRRRKVSFQDDTKTADSASKQSPVIIQRTEHSSLNLINACLLSSLLSKGSPLAGFRGEEDGTLQEYWVASVVSRALYVPDGDGVSRTCSNAIKLKLLKPTSPWHAFLSRKILDTVAIRDSQRVPEQCETTLEGRNSLIAHAANSQICHRTY